MNYPKYRVITLMRAAHSSELYSNFIDFDTEDKAHEYINNNKSNVQRVIAKITSEHSSYLIYLEKKNVS